MADYTFSRALREEYQAKGMLLISPRIPSRFYKGRTIISQKMKATVAEAKRTMLKEVKRQFVEKNLIATGQLYRSLKVREMHEIAGGGGRHTFGVYASGPAAAYLPFVEFGRAPGWWVQPNSLYNWMRARGIPLSVAGAVAASISKKGIKAKHPMEAARKQLFREIAILVEHTVEEIGDAWLKFT